MSTIYVELSFLIGIILTGLFLIVILRLNESWWLSQGEFNQPFAIYIYSFMPIGVFFLFLSISSYYQFKETISSQICHICFGFVIFLSIFLLISPPKQIKPSWLQWLEQEYDYCLNIISDIARKMPSKSWENLVNSQPDLQKWIDEQYENTPKAFDKAWEHERNNRFAKQAEQDGSYVLKIKEPLSGYIPEHRREEEVERIKWENTRSKKKKSKETLKWEERLNYTKYISLRCPNKKCEQGITPCTQCKGAGKVKNNICSRCSGSGYIQCNECVTCETCKGKGYRMRKLAKRDCYACSGTKRINKQFGIKNREVSYPGVSSPYAPLWMWLPMVYLLLWMLYVSI